MFDLSNKVIVLVGGNGILGSNIFETFIKKESRVAVIDGYFDRVDKIINLNKSSTKNNLKIRTNITKENEVQNSLKKILKKWKKVDVLVNFTHYKGNSNSLRPKADFFSSLENYPFHEWKKTLDVNLNGLFLTTQIFGRQMIKQKYGVIINISSTYGIISPRKDIYGDSGINSPVGYAATKAAIINFTRYVSTHWAKYGIRANVLSPGGIENINQSKDFKKLYKKNTPLNRMASEKDFNGALVFLASDESSYMTGSNLIIDGGWTAW